MHDNDSLKVRYIYMMIKRTSNAFYMRCRRQKRSLKGEHK